MVLYRFPGNWQTPRQVQAESRGSQSRRDQRFLMSYLKNALSKECFEPFWFSGSVEQRPGEER